MNEKPPYRVVHAPYDVGGNSMYLAQAETALGFHSTTLVYFKQWFGFPSDEDLSMQPGADPLRYPAWWATMVRLARCCDVLHFNFGSSFLTDSGRSRIYADLPFWRRLGLCTFVSFQGCDSRLASYCIENFPVNACLNCRNKSFCQSTHDHFRRECLSQLGRHFDGVFCVNPDLMHNIPGAQFLPYSNCDLDEWRHPVGFDCQHAGPVRILHAPTWRDIKGTDAIIHAVEELKREGEDVELVLVEKVPHTEVRRIYESVDLLVDQVLVGWYGGLAVELMALAKPVVAYIRTADLRFLPPRMREDLPVVSADPGTLKETLRPLVRSADKRRELGRRCRQYVETWHHPRVVAEMTTAAYAAALERRSVERRGLNKAKTLAVSAWPTVVQLAGLYWTTSVFRNGIERLGLLAAKVTFHALLPAIRACSFIRLRTGRPASVWGTMPILTTPLLARADRLLGFRSDTVVYSYYHITKTFDYILKNRIDFICRYAPLALRVYYRSVLLWALFRYDVFHYFYDQGFLERDGRFGVNQTELNWLRKAGKRVFLYAYGADVRTRKATIAMGTYNCCMHCETPGQHCICDDDQAEKKQASYRQYATALIAMGDMKAYVPGAKNLHYWPFDTNRTPFVGATWDGRRPLRLLHVPNHEWAKGTVYLKQAIQSLARSGIQFELVQVRGRSNAEVLRLMGEADIVADQFLIGWFGYTALEALAVGKVVLCYIRDPEMLLAPDECPLVSANPDTLERTLADLASWSLERFERLGRDGRRYVEKHYSIPSVACRLAAMYAETAALPPATLQKFKKHTKSPFST